MQELKKLNSDESVFNFVKQHLIHQNQKSVQHIETDEEFDQNSCLYRGIQNLKCAVGCLIEDQFYDAGIEQKGVIDLSVQNIIRQSLPNWKPNWGLLYALQEIHDQFNVEDWKRQLENVNQMFIVEKKTKHQLKAAE